MLCLLAAETDEEKYEGGWNERREEEIEEEEVPSAGIPDMEEPDSSGSGGNADNGAISTNQVGGGSINNEPGAAAGGPEKSGMEAASGTDDGASFETTFNSRSNTGTPDSAAGVSSGGDGSGNGDDSGGTEGQPPTAPPGASTSLAPAQSSELASPTLPGGAFPGSGGGNVTGLPNPNSSSSHLNAGEMLAIALASVLFLALAIFLIRFLLRRSRENAHRPGNDLSHLPPMYSDTNLIRESNTATANRLRGGLIDPYSGSASFESLPSFYRIEPFAVPSAPGQRRTAIRPPIGSRPSSSARLLDVPGAMYRTRSPSGSQDLPDGAAPPAVKSEVAGPQSSLNAPAPRLGYLPRSAWSTPTGSPLASPPEGGVSEFPPTYASLSPQPSTRRRRWFPFW